MSSINISLLADHPEAAPVVAQWYFDEWGGFDSVDAVTQLLLQGQNRNELPLLYLAYIRGQLVGSGEIKYKDVQSFPNYNYWLDGIYVPEDHRGLGISTRLIDFGISTAKRLGLSDLNLRCTEANVSLYQKYGFSVVARDESKFIMQLALSAE